MVLPLQEHPWLATGQPTHGFEQQVQQSATVGHVHVQEAQRHRATSQTNTLQHEPRRGGYYAAGTPAV